jgi:APA family basic amino acid/polyamine antiporter
MSEDHSAKPLGFWSCWSLSVGVMIGSGIFLLPTVLAPYGLLSFGGWLITGAGSILLALVFAQLASRTTRSGGPYVYTQEAFGTLPGFVIAWGYWISYWTAVPAVAIAFVGYLTVFVPQLTDNPVAQAVTALGAIWTLTLINMRGLKEGGFVQLVMTLLKLIPLFAIIGLGLAAGQTANLPAFNPTNGSPIAVLAATALLTMWAFVGFESATAPAAAVKDAQRVIPRALLIGTITVTFIYLAATASVMLLVPADVLANSTSPFAEAARGFGAWGPTLITIGALISTAGSLNGNIFVSGQMPMAVALDGLAPRILTKLSKGGSPYIALLLSSTMGSLLLVANYSRGLIGAFTFLLMMSTLATLVPYLFSAAAELRFSLKSARGWAGVALLGGLYALFAIVGSGLEVMAWGAVLFLAGIPIYYTLRALRPATA